MKHKHILRIGGVLITMVILLAGLMYYLISNQGICPLGTFACANSTKCLAQMYICDQITQCPLEDDEDDCIDFSGDWDFASSISQNVSRRSCEFDNPPENCNYTECGVTCQYLDEIPQNLAPNILQLNMNGSSIGELKANELDRYTELNALQLIFNGIEILEEGVFKKQRDLELLILSDNQIREISRGHLRGLANLIYLYADKNKIVAADFFDLNGSETFNFLNMGHNLLTSSTLKLPYLPALKEISLNNNRLEMINQSLFFGCPALRSLNMEDNLIQIVEANAFENLRELTELNLANNGILRLYPYTFKPLGNLTKLWLGFNPFEDIPADFSTSLPNLQSLHFEGLSITEDLKKNEFDAFQRLEHVYFKKFHYCATYAPNVKKCHPATDGVSSLSHLLDKPLLRAAVWSISTVTCLGNILVLWGRFTANDENRVLSIVIRHLAVADMLMGIYLLGIAVQDIRYRDNYNEKASSWMSSLYCTTLGALAMTSSQVSPLILSFMSVERFFVIVPPLSHRETPRPIALMMMCVFWLIGIAIAIGPAIYWWNSTKFYGINGMCFPLYIEDPYQVGWEYSAFLCIGVNLLSVVIMASAYAGMFASIWRTQRATPLPVSDSEFALRLFLIVITNALCWAPIIALKIQAMASYPVAPELHVWVVTFFLPINSAVNPLLYTFTTTRFRERLNEGWFGKVRNYFTGTLARQDSQISTATVDKNSFRMNYQSRYVHPEKR